MRNWDFQESKGIINPSHQIPYFNVSNTGSMWFLFSWWNWNDLYVKSCHVFWWGLLWNPQGLRRLWVESWQNEANFQQSRKWSCLYEQRQTRECFSQSGVTTAAPLPSSPAVTSFIWPHLTGHGHVLIIQGQKSSKESHTPLPRCAGSGQQSIPWLQTFVRSIFG